MWGGAALFWGVLMPDAKAVKQEDVHTHEVMLPDGSAVMTGPPIGETEHEEVAAPEVAVVAAVPEKRVQQGGRKAAVAAPAPPADAADARLVVSRAIDLRKADDLPPEAREIFDRMRASYLRFVAHRRAQGGGHTKAGRPLEDYADMLAWRAVAQQYDLTKAAKQAAPPAPRLRLVKGPPVAIVASSDGGRYFVPALLKWRDAELHHESIDNRAVPGTEGVVVVSGLTRPNGRRNVIGVWVPYAVAGDQPHGGGAVDWVRRNWELVYQVGMSNVDLAHTVRDPIFKFVSKAANAKERITYGVVYTPFEVDLQGQYATEREVAKLAHRFMASKEGAAKVMHRTLYTATGDPVGEIVESWLVKTRGNPKEPYGSWMIGTRWHPSVWPDVEAGRIRGFSMGGDWTVVPIKEAA